MKQLAKNAPLGDKMPTEEALTKLETRKGSGVYGKSMSVTENKDGTTNMVYSWDGLSQVVTYGADGNMIKDKIKTIDKNGFTSAQVDYFINEKGQKCWVF